MAASNTASVSDRPLMLKIEALTYTYPEESAPALRDMYFRLRPGECVCVHGPSGCGKSTLLLAIKGLLPPGSLRGAVEINSSEEKPYTDRVGLVFQNAETQILCATVAEEVAFGPENLGTPPHLIAGRVVSALRAVNLTGFQQRNVERLSAGQKQRLTIAAVLSMEPRLILLDEPTSQLDNRSKVELAHILAELKGRGHSLLITEHHLEPFRRIADRYLRMDQGAIVEETTFMPVRPAISPLPSAASDTPASDAPVLVTADALSLSFPDSGVLFDNFSLRIRKGERIHLYGENGTGKSILLRCLAGVVHPHAGTLKFDGKPLAKCRVTPDMIGYLFQNPQRQLFEDTVFKEVAFSLKRFGLNNSRIEERVHEALVACEALHLRDRLPLSLSFGEQHRVALASVLARRPALLLLDEPFAGLDPPQRLRLLRILAGLRHTTSVVLASHDPLPDLAWADRTVLLGG